MVQLPASTYFYRFTDGYNGILQLIVTAAQVYFLASYQLAADIQKDQYHFPFHITPTDLHPDIILWSDSQRTLNIIELTVCYGLGLRTLLIGR